MYLLTKVSTSSRNILVYVCFGHKLLFLVGNNSPRNTVPGLQGRCVLCFHRNYKQISKIALLSHILTISGWELLSHHCQHLVMFSHLFLISPLCFFHLIKENLNCVYEMNHMPFNASFFFLFQEKNRQQGLLSFTGLSLRSGEIR